MNAKHTPGPWISRQPEKWCGRYRVETPAGIEIAAVPQDEANARLIAAAPELLDALEAIIGHDAHLLNPYRVEAARIAIAKARGE